MATYTITSGTAGAPVDYAALGTRVNGDIYNLNGGYLLVDCDSRYGLGGAAAAAFSNIVGSAALGGTIEFNSTKVRLIPYNTGIGNVPAADTVISQGTASGKLIGVYSALNVAPTAAATAMPASGFIKIRAWNSVPYTAIALVGITAMATAADGPGWLECVGLDASTATINRLNGFKVLGDYYAFQGTTTTGANTGTYQLPTNGSAVVYCPGVEVETAVSSGIYEFYPCAGTRAALAANIATDAVRGKFCWIAATTGLVRFGHDGTNATGGFTPVAGCKIRVPNIFFTCCVAAATANVLPNATLATRYEFLTTGGGVIDIEKAACNWYLNLAQPFSVRLVDTSTFEAIILTECASPIAWSNVGVGQSAANSQLALTMGLNFAGGTMNKCVWSRAAQAASGNYVNSWADCSGFTVTNEKMQSLTKAANATAGSVTLTRVVNSNWSNTVLGGGRVLEVTCTDVKFTSSIYYDNPATTTGTAIPFFAFDIGTNCLNCTFDGLTFGGLVLCQPYLGILSIGSAGCANTKLRNLGTPSAPLDLGGAQVNGTWTQATTTATVTTGAAHGLKVNDIVYVDISSNTAIITVGLKTVTAVGSTTTYSFVCLTGTLTGTVVYYPTMAATVVSLAAGAAANSVKVQRVYTQRTRTGLLSGDNSSSNVTFESVWGDPVNAHLLPELNAIMRGVRATASLAAQVSVYGTHFIDFYTTGTPANLAAVAWARTTTVATVTSTAHGLRTGDSVVVNVTSDAAATVLGVKSITATTADAYTFTCLNAGLASGTLSFLPLNGRVAVQMNEATATTTAQVTLANGAAFTSAGGLYMPVIGHQVDFTSPVNIRAHGSFPIAEAVMAGGTIANYDVKYSLNNGTTYYNLYYERAGGSGAAAASTFTVTDATGVAIGDYVWGTGIAPNSKVTAIATNTLTVDLANTAAVSGIIRFNHLPFETAPSSTVGFSLKIRVITKTTNTTAITSLFFYTYSSSTNMQATYDLDTSNLTLTGLQAGSDIVVLTAGTSTNLINVDANAGSSYIYTYATLGNVDIGVFKVGYVPFYIRNYALSSTNASLPVAQVADRNYA